MCECVCVCAEGGNRQRERERKPNAQRPPPDVGIVVLHLTAALQPQMRRFLREEHLSCQYISEKRTHSVGKLHSFILFMGELCICLFQSTNTLGTLLCNLQCGTCVHCCSRLIYSLFTVWLNSAKGWQHPPGSFIMYEVQNKINVINNSMMLWSIMCSVFIWLTCVSQCLLVLWMFFFIQQALWRRKQSPNEIIWLHTNNTSRAGIFLSCLLQFPISNMWV